MRTAIKKVYISVLVTVLCLITVGATTYAWIGILTNSTFENFDLNVNSSNLKEYGVEISLDGINFTTEIDAIDLKKQILLNYGYKEEQLSSADIIENRFNMFNMGQCTVKPNYYDNSMGDFIDIYGNTSKKYFKFDIYVSPYKVYETSNLSNYQMDLFLRGAIFEGTVATKSLANEYIYPSNFTNVNGNIVAGTVIKDTKVDSSYASRLAIQKFNAVDKYKPEQYENKYEILDLIIYQGGTYEPTYDINTGLYSFGGILDTPYNLAAMEHNTFTGNLNNYVPDWAIERGKKELEVNETNSQIIDSSKEEEVLTIDKMMKLTIYFWFEGWDADCFNVIDKKPVSINLNFSTSYRDE